MSDDELTIRKEYQKDCLHLNEKGYEVLNAELQKVINTNKIK
jgi:lysophospholipase L1-like esterase